MSACNAILLALVARDRLGRGQHVEVALFDIAVAMTQFYGMAYLITGVNQSRFRAIRRTALRPSASTMASDGPFYMACANDRLYPPPGDRSARPADLSQAVNSPPAFPYGQQG